MIITSSQILKSLVVGNWYQR